jgi:hypothetical protein
MCNWFSTKSKEEAKVCYWTEEGCKEHAISFPYSQLPAGVILPKPKNNSFQLLKEAGTLHSATFPSLKRQ